MERFDHIVIGGGIAGVTAAETIRGRDANASILVVGDEPHELYSRVILPHVVRGKSTEDKPFLRQRGHFEKLGITYRVHVAATRVSARDKTVAFSDGTEATYGALLVATGGSARKLDVPGAAEAGCLQFQTFDDMRAIVASRGTASALVYGGGFIGLEFVMSFVHFGAPVTAVVRGEGFFSRVLDADGCRLVTETVAKNGVTVRVGSAIKGVTVDGPRKTVYLDRGEPVTCQTVATGIGIEPNVGFLAGSDIPVRNGVVVDDQLRSVAPGVFAAGDVAEFLDASVGSHHIVGNWQNALLQGKVVGENMTGGDKAYDTVTSYAITCFGLPIVFMGTTDHADTVRVARRTDAGAFLQLFLLNGRVVGATCVGPFGDRLAVSRLISSRKPLSAAALSALADPRQDLAALTP
jgi:NAD(P)H-nitrite reductase large subunit